MTRFGRSLAYAALVLPLAALAQGEAARVPGAPAPACLVPGAWHGLAQGAPHPLSGAEALALVSDRDVVLLGEKHDEYDHHAWQLQTLAALYALRPQMVIGFEAFPRRAQAVLDQWVAG